jgi:hypothetical protein
MRTPPSRGLLPILAAAFLAFAPVPAGAQLFRAYLAPNGSDANACTLPAPCRLLPAALNAVADGGEIWMLDSANYNTGPVNVTKSVTILAVPGAVGSVIAANGSAINISTPGVKVALRNLVIVPLPGAGGTTGIFMGAGAGLTVENCLIANLPQFGIDVSTAASVRVADTTIRDNAGHGLLLQSGARATVTRVTVSGNGSDGIRVGANVAGTTTTADIADSTMDANGWGVRAVSTNAAAAAAVSVEGSRIVRNTTEGLVAQSNLGASVALSGSNNIVSNNGAGFSAINAGSKIWASGNAVSDNANWGFYNSAASLFESAGNNALRNNGFNKSGTITVISPLE